MRQAIIDLLSSKKALATLASLLTIVVGKFGWDVDVETLLMLVAPLAVYVAAQGIADHGKSAAVIAAKSSGPKDGAA